MRWFVLSAFLFTVPAIAASTHPLNRRWQLANHQCTTNGVAASCEISVPQFFDTVIDPEHLPQVFCAEWITDDRSVGRCYSNFDRSFSDGSRERAVLRVSEESIVWERNRESSNEKELLRIEFRLKGDSLGEYVMQREGQNLATGVNTETRMVYSLLDPNYVFPEELRR